MQRRKAIPTVALVVGLTTLMTLVGSPAMANTEPESFAPAEIQAAPEGVLVAETPVVPESAPEPAPVAEILLEVAVPVLPPAEDGAAAPAEDLAAPGALLAAIPLATPLTYGAANGLLMNWFPDTETGGSPYDISRTASPLNPSVTACATQGDSRISTTADRVSSGAVNILVSYPVIQWEVSQSSGVASFDLVNSACGQQWGLTAADQMLVGPWDEPYVTFDAGKVLINFDAFNAAHGYTTWGGTAVLIQRTDGSVIVADLHYWDPAAVPPAVTPPVVVPPVTQPPVVSPPVEPEPEMLISPDAEPVQEAKPESEALIPPTRISTGAEFPDLLVAIGIGLLSLGLIRSNVRREERA